jgi:hypothetical protein
MAYTFDGTTKIITYSIGTTGMDVKDLYSRWKDWVSLSGSKYLQAMNVVGGEPIDEANGIYVSSYVFLENGWRIRPAEENHTLKVANGILLTSTGDDPFIETAGYYNVQIKFSQPVATQSVVIETGTSGLTEEESNQLSAITTLEASVAALSAAIDLLSGDSTEISNQVYEVSLQADALSGQLTELSGNVAKTLKTKQFISLK